MRQIKFEEGIVYHIYNRGADKREVFPCDSDKYRFISDLAYMNTSLHILFPREYLARRLSNFSDDSNGKNFKLVDILAFVLMPNHFHLMVSQRVENGIPLFMHKLSTAYTMYFNVRYEHSGVLFQGRYKASALKRDAYFDHLPFYIHANPLKLAPTVTAPEDRFSYLKNYKWSSFRYYCGIRNFDEVISPGVLTDYFTESGGFHAYMSRKLEAYDEAQPHHEAQPLI